MQHEIQSINPNLQGNAGGGPADHREGLLTAYRNVDIARQALLEQAYALGTEYTERRTAAAGGQFAGLTLIARRRKRSVTIGWVVLHFKQGRRTGTQNIPKSRASLAYDVSALKRKSPDWLHEAAVEAELKARPLREALAKLTDADMALRSAATRLQLDELLLPVSEFDASSANDDVHEPIPY